MTIIVLLWIIFTIIYFHKNIKYLLKGRQNNTVNAGLLENNNVFGNSRIMEFNVVKNENNNVNINNKNDNTAFLDNIDAQEDVNSDDFDMNYTDSGDEVGGEEITDGSCKKIEDLRRDTLAVFAAMDNDIAENEEAARIAADFRGTHLFEQIETMSGNDGKERAKKLLDMYDAGVWSKDYERQFPPEVSAEALEQSKDFDITLLT